METSDTSKSLSKLDGSNWPARALSAAMLILIAALGVMLFRAGHELSTLKHELVSLRAAAGHLDIQDRSKVYAVRIPASQPNEWAWRVYLPGNHTYLIHNQSGKIPALDDPATADRESGSGSSGTISSGEFILRFRLVEESNGYWLAKFISRDGSGSWGGVQRSSWLTDHDWEESSAIPVEGQRELAADATFDLIRLRQESAVDTDDPERRAETIALWITGASSNGP